MAYRILIALAALMVLALAALPETGHPQQAPPGAGEGAKKEPETVDIALNPLFELNFKKRQEVLSYRTYFVRQHPEFAPKGYRPDDDMFRNVKDGVAWWGVTGMCYYGEGEKSIEGPAELSRYLGNPYMLVAPRLKHPPVFDMEKMAKIRSYACVPTPKSLVWRKDRSTAWLTYDLSSYLSYKKEYDKFYVTKVPNVFRITAFNAQDMGYRYLCPIPERSRNVTFSTPPGAVMALKEFFYWDGSAGGPQGRIDVGQSMRQDLEITVTQMPAYACFKLWVNNPLKAETKPDMWWMLEMR